MEDFWLQPAELGCFWSFLGNAISSSQDVWDWGIFSLQEDGNRIEISSSSWEGRFMLVLLRGRDARAKSMVIQWRSFLPKGLSSLKVWVREYTHWFHQVLKSSQCISVSHDPMNKPISP